MRPRARDFQRAMMPSAWPVPFLLPLSFLTISLNVGRPDRIRSLLKRGSDPIFASTGLAFSLIP